MFSEVFQGRAGGGETKTKQACPSTVEVLFSPLQSKLDIPPTWASIVCTTEAAFYLCDSEQTQPPDAERGRGSLYWQGSAAQHSLLGRANRASRPQNALLCCRNATYDINFFQVFDFQKVMLTV